MDLFLLIELIYRMKEIILSLISIIVRIVFIKLLLLLLLCFMLILQYLCSEENTIYPEMLKTLIFIQNKKFFATIIFFGLYLTLLDCNSLILIMVLCKDLCSNMKSWKHGLLFFGLFFLFLLLFYFQFYYLCSIYTMYLIYW